MTSAPFRFKQFEVRHASSAMKVGTDGVLLGAWADVSGVKRALDIGAGSGLIALMLAQRQPDAWVDAVEIDEQAAQEAADNMRLSPWPDRLHCEHTAIQDFVAQQTSGAAYDLIVSNPPFFTGGVLSEAQSRQEVRHTIKLSHSDLLAAVRSLLHPQGKFCVVLPLLEGLRFEEMAAHYHLYTTRRAEVSPRLGKGVNRLLLQMEMQPSQQEEPQQETFAIYESASNDWTDAYRALTRDFYLKA